MATNRNLDFSHLRSTGFEHQSDQESAAGWDAAFKAAKKEPLFTEKHATSSGWDRAFKRAGRQS